MDGLGHASKKEARRGQSFWVAAPHMAAIAVDDFFASRWR
jgi:hypothetical protein